MTVSGGFDLDSGPDDRQTRSALAVAALDLGAVALAGGGMRYDDDLAGPGTGVIAGLGVPLGPVATLRLTATQFFADDGAQGSRFKFGPLLGSPIGATVALSYTRDDFGAGARSNGALVEASLPVHPRVSLRANAGVVATNGAQGGRGALGAEWMLLPHLELAGEIGAAQRAAASQGRAVPTRDPLAGLPVLGQGSAPGAAPATSGLSLTSLVSIRANFP